MNESLHAVFAAWGNFYVITGTSAATLTGLQFIVQTLIASDEQGTMTAGDPQGGIEAFGSPTVVHFTLAILLSALMCVPWPGYASLQGMLVLLGAGALVYVSIVLRRARRQRSYVPVMEDWFWHIVMPAIAGSAVVTAGILLATHTRASAFLVALATLLVLSTGIHNAWDTVTFITLRRLRGTASPGAPEPHAAQKTRKGRR